MKEEYLERAIKDTSDVLKPVLDAAYSLKPVPKMEMLEIAMKVNEELGFDLFEDLYYPRLVRDFSIVTRAVTKNAIGN